MDYKIEDNIPIPGVRDGHNSIGVTAVLRKLEVGQSVVFPQYVDTQRAYAVRAAVHTLPTKKFVLRTLKDRAGVRVWRTS